MTIPVSSIRPVALFTNTESMCAISRKHKGYVLVYVPIQGESVNILLNFTQFFETRIEYRFQIFTAHSCDFLLPSYARLA